MRKLSFSPQLGEEVLKMIKSYGRDLANPLLFHYMNGGNVADDFIEALKKHNLLIPQEMRDKLLNLPDGTKICFEHVASMCYRYCNEYNDNVIDMAMALLHHYYAMLPDNFQAPEAIGAVGQVYILYKWNTMSTQQQNAFKWFEGLSMQERIKYTYQEFKNLNELVEIYRGYKSGM